VSRVRSRLNRLEIAAGPVGACPCCRGKPPHGCVAVTTESGERAESGTKPCPGCGQRGPTLWIVHEPRPGPKGPAA